MAITHQNLLPRSTLLLSITILLSSAVSTSEAHPFSRPISPQTLGLEREKLTHLHFYFHDIVSGKNVTAIPIAHAEINSSASAFFGLVMMMDDPLTLRPDPNSKLVGRAQGIYASASQSELSFLMVLNFAFMEGKYNGSNLSVLGRNAVFSGVREMPIVGGSGLFRFARGYAQARTHAIDFKTGNAIVEYNVYVFHY